MSTISVPFLTAIRHPDYPAAVVKAAEREFTVTYSSGGCNCQNCRKSRPIKAISRVDAREKFERKFPLVWVLSVD